MKYLVWFALTFLLTASASAATPHWLRLEMVGPQDRSIPVLWFSASELDIAFSFGDQSAIVPDALFQQLVAISSRSPCSKPADEPLAGTVSITEFDGASERAPCLLEPQAACAFLSELFREARQASSALASASIAEFHNDIDCNPALLADTPTKEAIADAQSRWPLSQELTDVTVRFAIAGNGSFVTLRLSAAPDSTQPWRLRAESLIIEVGGNKFRAPPKAVAQLDPKLLGLSRVVYRPRNPRLICVDVPTEQSVQDSQPVTQLIRFSIDTKRNVLDLSDSCYSWRGQPTH